jgi:hypothetical protein
MSTKTKIALFESYIRTLGHQTSYFEKFDPATITLSDYECREKTIEPLMENVEKLYTELLTTWSKEDKESNTPLYTKFVGDYFMLLAKVKEQLRVMRLASQPVPINVTNPSPVPSGTTSVRTPRLEIPKFDGTSSSWIRFHDIFESVIHAKSNLSNVEKFSYLVSSVKLPAGDSNVLDNFKICENDYEAAWKALCDRYNDKSKILAMHCKKIFSLEQMKSESKSEIQRIIDTFTAQISAVKQLGYGLSEANDFANMMIVQLALTKLESKTLREWKKHNKDDCATWSSLLKFLTAMSRSLDDEEMSLKKDEHVKGEIKSDSKSQSKPAKTSFVAKSGGKPRDMKCPSCADSHLLISCPTFNKMDVNDRHSFAKEKRLCWNCLSPAHQSKACTSKHKCKKCDKPHNTLLHLERSQSSLDPTTNSILSPTSKPFEPFHLKRQHNFGGEPSSNSNVASHAADSSTNFRRRTFLSTVVIDVADREGNFHPARALLDTGSDDNFVTTHFSRKLGLKLSDVCVPLKGIGEKTSIVNHQTSATISSLYGPYKKELDFSVMPSITGNLPNQSLNVSNWNIPPTMFLADPNFNIAGPIDMLLSIDVFYDILLGDQVELNDGPKMIHTKLGWLVGGSVNLRSTSSPQSLLSCFKVDRVDGEDELKAIVGKYYEAEEVDVEARSWTAEEQYCEDDFKATATRGDDGKWIVHMPENDNISRLGTNQKNAIVMLYAQEGQRSKNEVVNRHYIASMRDFEDKVHMQEVKTKPGEFRHHLPHHGVVNLANESTPVRPVCNASSKSETGVALNEALCVGPVVQPESFDILLRFREKPYVLMGDLSKMYRNIWVDPTQRHLLTILWRENPETDPIKTYEMTTVTFGTACASFLATRVLLEIANQSEERFPIASRLIKNSIYVDDFLAGFRSIEEARNILSQLRLIFASSGMTFCKLAANSAEILDGVPAHHLKVSTDNEENNFVKALGIHCELRDDLLTYKLKTTTSEGSMTKTTVLSENARIYDPIGFLGPTVLKGKLFIKKLWMDKLGWKDELPEADRIEWNEFRSQLHLLNEVKIKRQCLVNDPILVELHGFSDASIEAYGCCVYLRSEDVNGNVEVALICAKSKVAPMKQQSLARLELCGALLLAKLSHRVKKILETPIDQVHLWCDSTIVLHWISMVSSTLQTYVGNRVAEI